MNFDEWLEQREARLHHGYPLKEVQILRLLKAYRSYLRHLLSIEAVQNTEAEHIITRQACAKIPGMLAALEKELMKR